MRCRSPFSVTVAESHLQCRSLYGVAMASFASLFCALTLNFILVARSTILLGIWSQGQLFPEGRRKLTSICDWETLH